MRFCIVMRNIDGNLGDACENRRGRVTMSDTAGPSRRREETRRRLLDAAAEVFAEVGMDAASVEVICDRAGFTRGAFYSNFASKDELFFALVGLVAQERVRSVADRVAALEADGALDMTGGNVVEVVSRVLEIGPEDRLGVLLFNEIRIHALRAPELAAAYLEQDTAILDSVARLVDDIVAGKDIRFRLEPRAVARLLMTVWESTSVRGVMAGLPPAELARHTGEELGRVAAALIER